jgi:ATP-dependent DNA helicase RecG
MSLEGQDLERKSLRTIEGRTANWDEIARHCVAFANARGGRLLIGFEDGEAAPPVQQRIADDLIERVRRRIGELTVNVTCAVQRELSAETGGEYLRVIISRSHAPASTTDGRYYFRIVDESKPLVGEQVQRLLNERNAQPWEMLTTLRVPRSQTDPAKLAAFTAAIRASSRVKASVKEKSNAELLNHYYLAIDRHLTNLGVLCVGRRQDRAQLGAAPVIQFIKYDQDDRKVSKLSWDDHSLTPMELVEAVWRDVPDFRETYELPDGLFRQYVPAYDQRVVRELLVNALVHRPYTQRGRHLSESIPGSIAGRQSGIATFGSHPSEHFASIGAAKR